MTELYSAHPAMFKNRPFSFILSILLIPAFGLGILILLVWYLRCKSSKLIVNEKEILFEEGLLSKSRSEITLSSVRTVKVEQSFVNRMFGVGTIELYTAGDTPEIIAHGMPDPNKIRDII